MCVCIYIYILDITSKDWIIICNSKRRTHHIIQQNKKESERESSEYLQKTAILFILLEILQKRFKVNWQKISCLTRKGG